MLSKKENVKQLRSQIEQAATDLEVLRNTSNLRPETLQPWLAQAQHLTNQLKLITMQKQNPSTTIFVV